MMLLDVAPENLRLFFPTKTAENASVLLLGLLKRFYGIEYEDVKHFEATEIFYAPTNSFGWAIWATLYL